jgi:hypothetical protein
VPQSMRRVGGRAAQGALGTKSWEEKRDKFRGDSEVSKHALKPPAHSAQRSIGQ